MNQETLNYYRQKVEATEAMLEKMAQGEYHAARQLMNEIVTLEQKIEDMGEDDE